MSGDAFANARISATVVVCISAASLHAFADNNRAPSLISDSGPIA